MNNYQYYNGKNSFGTKVDKPDFVEDAHLVYLYELEVSESCITTLGQIKSRMLEDYPLMTMPQIEAIVTYWVLTYRESHTDIEYQPDTCSQCKKNCFGLFYEGHMCSDCFYRWRTRN